MMVGTAVVGTAIRSASDPIFAAIEAHKNAMEAYNLLVPRQDGLEATIPKERRQTRGADEIIETDDPRWIKFQRQINQASDAEIEAECELTNVTPSSIAGVIALLEYASKIEKEIGFREIYSDPDEPSEKLGRSWYYFVTRNLADCLRTIEHAA